MARAGTAYVVTIGPNRADSDLRRGNRLLLSLVVERGMDAPGRCVVELADPEHDPVASGQSVTVAIDVGTGSRTVFSGNAYESAVTATSQVVRAADALALLADMHVEATYEQVTSDFIAKDLIGKAGAKTGSVASGPTLGAYVLHAQPGALQHLGALAALAGADIWTDGSGKVQIATPRQGPADHRFKLGENILALDVRAATPVADGVTVWGEGAAGSKGADAARWLTTDLSGVNGKAAVSAEGNLLPDQTGVHPTRRTNGALRAAADASTVAKAWAAAAASRFVRGRIDVSGSPGLEPGDLIALDGLPPDHAAAKLLAGGRALRVRGVRHVLDRSRGLRTTLEF